MSQTSPGNIQAVVATFCDDKLLPGDSKQQISPEWKIANYSAVVPCSGFFRASGMSLSDDLTELRLRLAGSPPVLLPTPRVLTDVQMVVGPQSKRFNRDRVYIWSRVVG